MENEVPEMVEMAGYPAETITFGVDAMDMETPSGVSHAAVGMEGTHHQKRHTSNDGSRLLRTFTSDELAHNPMKQKLFDEEGTRSVYMKKALERKATSLASHGSNDKMDIVFTTMEKSGDHIIEIGIPLVDANLYTKRTTFIVYRFSSACLLLYYLFTAIDCAILSLVSF